MPAVDATPTAHDPPLPPGARHVTSQMLLGDLARQHNYGTLDNVPDFAMLGLEQLYALLLSGFESYEGVVEYGPRSLDDAHAGYWGRAMMLPSQEMLQMRFAPKALAESDGGHEHPVVMLAARVVNMVGQAQVSSAVLFRASALQSSGVHEIVESQMRVVGCKGLHVLNAGLFKRHNPGRAAADHVAVSQLGPGAFDPFGYESVRPTSYSVYKVREAQHDHRSANGVSPGASVLKIAGEIVDVHFEDTHPLRVAEPITSKKWKEASAYQRDVVLQNPRGPAAGNTAIVAAATIIELLSAEGVVGMRANAFFEGALPDKFAGPHGVALSIAMAARLAMHWEGYRLTRPSACDQAANEQLRTTFESSLFGPLPALGERLWCIDVATRAALAQCQRAVATNHGMVEDQKFFWQRVGQRLITSTFGLGSVAGVPTDERFGPPWRLQNPLQHARDVHLASNGCLFEGLDAPVVALASVAQRRTALLTLLFDVERWLRTGQFDGRPLGQSEEGMDDALRHERVKLLLHDIMVPQMVQDLARRASGQQVDPDGLSYEDRVAKETTGHFNLSAMGHALNDCKELLLCGPMVHFKYNCGAYIVASTQTSPCTDCEAPVHVLQGVMLANSYAHCTACHAKRCLECSAAYARAVCVDTPQRVGKRCRRCGAEPAWVDVKTSTNEATGEKTSVISLGERTATYSLPGKLRSEGEAPPAKPRDAKRDARRPRR